MSNTDKFDLGLFEEVMTSLANLVAAEALLGNTTTKKQQDAMACVFELAKSLDQAQHDRDEAARLERETERKAKLAAAKDEEARNLPDLVRSFLDDPDSPFLEAFYCYTTKGTGKNKEVTSYGILLVHERGRYIGKDAMDVYLRDGAIMLGSGNKGSFAYLPFSKLTPRDLGAPCMSFYAIVDTLVCDQGLDVNAENVQALSACKYC